MLFAEFRFWADVARQARACQCWTRSILLTKKGSYLFPHFVSGYALNQNVLARCSELSVDRGSRGGVIFAHGTFIRNRPSVFMAVLKGR